MTVFFLKMCKIKCFQENLWLIIQLQPAKGVDFIVDAIDTVKSKIELIKFSFENNIQAISSFGAGNRMDAKASFCI